MKENVLRDKSYQLALRIVKFYKFIASEQKEYVLSKQILCSWTSIGVNVEEANRAQSKTDFIHKLSVAQKEAAETNYWLRLLRDSEFLTTKQAESLLTDCDEITKNACFIHQNYKRKS